jgi:2-polyprenyl-3-methyl-5-hydroxy-6-metoxy-1,4-benzoquinol methylase
MIKFQDLPCPLCGSNEYKPLGKPRRIDALISSLDVPEVFKAKIVKCKKCSLIYVTPFPRYSDELLIKMYSNDNNYFLELTPYMERVIHTLNPERRFKTVQRLAKKEIKNFLEIGCGLGYGLQAARKFGWNVYGQDLSPDFAKAARERTGVDVSIGQLDEKSFPGKKFDVIYIDSVLEHLVDPVKYMKCIIHYLSPEGIIYLVLPNEDSIPNQLIDGVLRLMGNDRTYRIAPFTEPYHLLGFSKSSIHYLAKSLNLEVISLVRHYSYNHRERYKSAVSLGRFVKKEMFGAVSLLSDIFDDGMNMEVVFTPHKSRIH